MKSNQPTSTFKVVIAGEANVGKTTLIRRYCTGKFRESRVMTIGVDFQIQVMVIDGRPVKLSIWDIAGQERFDSFRDAFYKGARAIALVYDVNDPASFSGLTRWQAESRRECPQARFLVVGNKIDLPRQVSQDFVVAWTQAQKLPYLETSARTGQGVKLLFEGLARLALAAGR